MTDGPEPDVRKTNPLRQEVIGHWPPDPRALFREQLGVEVIDGCASVDTSCGARATEGFTYSATFLRTHRGNCGWRISQAPGERIVWQTHRVADPCAATEGVVAVFALAFGSGSPFPPPTSVWELVVDDEPLLRFTFTKHDEVWHGRDASLAFQVKSVITAPPGCAISLDAQTVNESSASFGLAVLKLSPERARPGRAITLEIRPAGRTSSTAWCRLDQGSTAKQSAIPGYGILSELNYWRGLLLATGNRRRPRIDDYGVFFGDLHTHSGHHDGGGAGCGTGTPEENFRFARDVASLDFYALSEHEWQMPDGEGWCERNDMADRFNEPGRFVTIPAFEWGRAYGQRCVYYEKSHQDFASTESGAMTPADLWERLRRIDGRAITIAHHPSWSKVPVDWTFHDPRFDRLVEIYSAWGSSEHDDVAHGNKDVMEGCCWRKVLARGYRIGCIASSDAHDGCPGVSNGTSSHPNLIHRLGSGRVAVLAGNLTRQAVFDALYERRCYAVTGEPIVLDFRVNEVTMGGEIRARDVTGPPEVLVRVEAPLPVKQIEIIRDGRIVHLQHCDTRQASACFRDAQYGSAGRPHLSADSTDASYYYARVTQEDGEMAWSSPVWITSG